MVSLEAVEGYANAVWPGRMHAVFSIPDSKVGEQLILLTEHPQAERRALLSYAKDEVIAEIMVPKTIRSVDAVPVLGTGKVDYVTLVEMASTGMEVT